MSNVAKVSSIVLAASQAPLGTLAFGNLKKPPSAPASIVVLQYTFPPLALDIEIADPVDTAEAPLKIVV